MKEETRAIYQGWARSRDVQIVVLLATKGGAALNHLKLPKKLTKQNRAPHEKPLPAKVAPAPGPPIRARARGSNAKPKPPTKVAKPNPPTKIAVAKPTGQSSSQPTKKTISAASKPSTKPSSS
ncbi:hypothetical protein PIB30_050774 [Stylosanthes scabra]|uniref:Uncharacterized protein n=1 Tax=Stylosanthes scabra TaxID=79078 RepID=A0ABU6WI30_9FABA|nr:hypothetical protein [Stylosanthes scabra]